MSVKRMFDEIDSFELAEWEAYDRLEPIDHAFRAEAAAGIIASTTANCHKASDSEAFSAADFLNKWGSEWRDDTTDLEAQSAKGAAKVEDAIKILGLEWEK